MKQLVLALCKLNMQCCVRVARWAVRRNYSDNVAAEFVDEFMPPSVQISPLLFSRVMDDFHVLWRATPDILQAELNGCMESLRPKLASHFQGMMGSLTMQGYPMEECFVRILANAVHLGIYVERRLDGRAGATPLGERPHAPETETESGVAKQ
jgi:hypothetical protein